MTESPPAGLVLTPGASARRDHSGLVAIDQAVTNVGVAVERVDFPGPAAGKRRPDPPAVCIATIRTATEELALRLGVPTRRVANDMDYPEDRRTLSVRWQRPRWSRRIL